MSGLAWAFDAAEEAIDLIAAIAEASGGGLVGAAERVQRPKIGRVAAAAFRAAASPNLGFPRVVVTADSAAAALGVWTPRGVPWPKTEAVTILSPTRFRDLVEQARWRYRQPGR